MSNLIGIKGIIKISFSLVLFLLTNHAHSISTGMTGYSGNPATRNGAFCTFCHNTGSIPIVAITGSSSVTPGSTSSYSFSITGGQQQIGGLNVSASSGTLSVQTGDTSLKKAGQELTHTQAASISAGSITWNFDWQAPATVGTYTLYAAGVSANNDQAVTGDNAASTSLVITVAASGPTPVAIISSPLTATLNTNVIFDGSNSTAPSGSTVTQYDWNVDGTDYVNSGASYQTSFSIEGRHTATLTVTDSNNVTATTFADVIVGTSIIPVVTHTGPYTGVTGTAVNFDASASTTDPSTSLTNYIWDFGDGSAVVEDVMATTSHTYNTAGSYIVTIVAQDGKNMSGVIATNATITTTVPQPTTGEQLYNANCQACHGTAGTGSTARNIEGATQQNILNAIATIGTMKTISLTNAQVQLVADYLAVTGSTGDALYVGKCQVCHGVAGVGTTSAPAVIGATRVMILNKITSVPSMNSIVLDSAGSQLIADFLGTANDSTGAEFYATKCTICHGATGAGITGVAPAVNGATQSMIQNAIKSVGIMDAISLSNNNSQLVADFLGAGGNTGQEAYLIKCAICHGAGGVGGTAPFVKGATDYMIKSEVNGVSEMQRINLEGKSQLIANYLGGGGSTEQDYYTNKCLICHGQNGRGGSGSYGGPDIRNDSTSKFLSAIAKTKEMNGILLNNSEAQAIQSYLNGSGK